METKLNNSKELAKEISNSEFDKDLSELRMLKNTINLNSDYLRHYFGKSITFPSVKYDIAKLKHLSEYEVVQALKIDFKRWKENLSELPNCYEDKCKVLENKLFHIDQTYIEDAESPFKEVPIKFIRDRMIEYLKDAPNEWRTENLFYVKNELRNLFIIEKNDDIKKVLNQYLIEVCTMIDPDNKNINELINEPEPNEKILKRPNNTHNQQFALLENLGVIDYLKDKYNLPANRIGELIANIINRDIQNTRVMVSFTNTKECESKKDKNKDVIEPILIKSGIIKSD